jgi:hypothetical protein
MYDLSQEAAEYLRQGELCVAEFDSQCERDIGELRKLTSLYNILKSPYLRET